jgi:hypothetical protein
MIATLINQLLRQPPKEPDQPEIIVVGQHDNSYLY